MMAETWEQQQSCDWIMLEGGTRFVRADAVSHVEWLGENHDHGWDATPRWTKAWKLRVHTTHGVFVLHDRKDAKTLLTALGLPSEMPSEEIK